MLIPAFNNVNSTNTMQNVDSETVTIVMFGFELRRDFQQCGILTSVDSDEHVQPPFKLRTSKRCSVSSLTLIEYSSNEQGSDQTAHMRRLV